MEPPPISAVADTVSSFRKTVNCKLRLMCSYGGHIVPRPHDKSLCYAGGDSRIVAVDRRTTAWTLSAFTSHLSRVLYNNRPFVLKYQLPNEDLDSLISVTTDEDLQNMLEEHDRIVSSQNPSRIRLFLFPSNPESFGSVLHDPNAESWFCDALKGTKIMPRGQPAESGLVNGLMGLDCGVPSDASVEAQVESLSMGGDAKPGLDLCSVPESMVLETSSSFGSTSSSISMSNLPPIGIHGDDGGLSSQDKKVKMPSTSSIESDNSTASAISHPPAAIYQDPVVHVPSMETKVSSTAVESENIVRGDPMPGVPMIKGVQVFPYQVPIQSERIQNQQNFPYMQPGTHYIQQFPAGQMPISSYHPLYYSPLQQHAHNSYQPNLQYPVYLLPVRPPQPNNMSVQSNLVNIAPTILNPPQVHPPTTMITPQVSYTEVMAAAPPPELASKVYGTAPGATPLVDVPSSENQQQLVDLSEIHHSSQPVATAAASASASASKNTADEYEDDFAYAQIYKTQPSAPALLAQYQTLTNAGAMLLPETSKQQQSDNAKQHIRISQPQ